MFYYSGQDAFKNRPLSEENVEKIEFLLQKQKLFITIIQKGEYEEGFLQSDISNNYSFGFEFKRKDTF